MPNNSSGYEFLVAELPGDYRAAKKLFEEYAANLGMDLSFQHFEKELTELPLQYGSPSGGLILIKYSGEHIGCVGVRKFEKKIAELKRMYIQPAHQHAGLGKILLQKALTSARALGYQKIRLDTSVTMLAAVKLYRNAGFKEIPPYRFNPFPNTLFFEKILL